ncbi:MAG: amidohydrolase family protein [Metallosphaera sp.]
MGISNRTYTLRKCSYAVDFDRVRRDVNIVIEDDKIKYVGNEVEGDELDCSEFIVIPGLVNAHTHSAMTVLRGLYDEGELREWLSVIWKEEEKLSKDLMRLGTELAITEMIMWGTTAFIDMYFNPDQVRDLSLAYGIRSMAGPVLMRDKSVDDVIKELKALGEHDLFKPIINVHSLYAVDLAKIRELKESLNERPYIHMHLSETREELSEIKRKYGLFPIELIYRENLIKYTHGVHLGWVSSWELSYLKASLGVTHCPSSNMKLATGGSFPMREALINSINVTLGTDGAASNNSLSMFHEMKTAVLLQRHNYWSTEINASDVFMAATFNGYKMLGLKGGKIEPGYLADLVLIDKYQLYPWIENRILSHVVYNPPRSVDIVIVAGKIIYKKNGKLDDKFKKLINSLSSYF